MCLPWQKLEVLLLSSGISEWILWCYMHSSFCDPHNMTPLQLHQLKYLPFYLILMLNQTKTCWRRPLLVHGNYESSLVYFCVYMKDKVCSSLCRSELLNSSNFLKIYKCSSWPIIYHENRQCCLFQLHMRQNAIFHDILCLLNTFSSACFQVWFWYQLYGPLLWILVIFQWSLMSSQIRLTDCGSAWI